jgi:multidrug efflux system membrane fusion protein
LTVPPPHHGLRLRPTIAPEAGKFAPWAIAVLLAASGAAAWWAHAQQGERSAAGAPGPAASARAGGGPGGFGGPGGRRFGGGSRVQPVSVGSVRRREIRVTVNAIGTIAAANTAVVKAKVEGELKRLNFKEGQWVQAGTVIAELDGSAMRIALAQAEGQLARDLAQLQNARLDLERFRELLAKDAIAKQQVDTQQAQVQQLQGTVQTDQAGVESARLQLSYTRIVAPISGRIGLKQVDLGNVVKPGDAGGLATIAQTQPVNVVFAVPELHLPSLTRQLKAGQPLAVEAWDRDNAHRLAVGRVESIDNAIDAATGTIRLKAAFANADTALYPNQFVNVRLQLAALGDALAVPAAALLRNTEGAFVYVVGADKTVAARRVQAGAADGDWVAVQGPVEPGELVVTDGVDRLRDGAQVDVIKPPADVPEDERGGGRRKRGGPPQPGAASAPPRASPLSPLDAAAVPRGHQGPGGDFLSRLPPELAEKVKSMSPEERRAWFEQRRAERARREGGGT